MRLALGLDGCASGWVAVLLVDGAVDRVEVVPGVAVALRWADVDAVGIDIPIGLFDAAAREADVAARRRLPGRASTVFNAPPKAAVEAYRRRPGLDHATASALARATTGKGISQQAWRLVPRIVEVEDVVATGPDPLEVHPEVAFAELGRGQRLPRKTSWAGLAERRRLLAAVGVLPPERFPGDDGCAPDDVLDAAVVAWVADGRASGERLVRLPEPPQEDDRGRRVCVHARTPP
jgi:predicted RNase H-like nuclease